MENQSVLVIILNYRGQGVLLPCLTSVLPELGPQDACLVVDNGQEKELMEKVKKTFPQVRIIETRSNLGFSRGMNEGLRIAIDGGYDAAWILNNDTIVSQGALASLKQAKKNFPGANLFSPIIFSSKTKVWFAGGRINFWQMRTEHVQALPETTAPFITNFLTGCALFIPKETLKARGLFDERYFLYYEDAEYSWRIRSYGGRLLVVPEAQVLHHEVSEVHPEKTYWLVKSGVEFFARHTAWHLRPWMWGYLILRKLKNFFQLTCSDSQLARSIKRAYTDASTK